MPEDPVQTLTSAGLDELDAVRLVKLQREVYQFALAAEQNGYKVNEIVSALSRAYCQILASVAADRSAIQETVDAVRETSLNFYDAMNEEEGSNDQA